MTTRRKYWLHISSTNQATSQVNTAASPQTARNFGLVDEDGGAISSAKITTSTQCMPRKTDAPEGCVDDSNGVRGR
jgi:hypothetical protein